MNARFLVTVTLDKDADSLPASRSIRARTCTDAQAFASVAAFAASGATVAFKSIKRADTTRATWRDSLARVTITIEKEFRS